MLLLAGCATNPTGRKQQRAAAPKDLFDRTVKQYHLPSAEAAGAEKAGLLRQAAAGYEQLLRRYPDQPTWCAQALRSLGNVRAEQGRLEEAIHLYSRVAAKYPDQDWEIVQAWKSAADLLWDAGRRSEARAFHQRIVDRFDRPDAAAVIQTVVRGSKSRLAAGEAD